MSDIEARAQSAIDTFEQMVVAAEVNLEKGAGMRKVAGILSSFDAAVASFTADEAVSALTIAPEGFAESWQALIDSAAMTSMFVGKVPGLDREEGDAMARKVDSLVVNNWIEDDETIDLITGLVARWQKCSPPVKSSRSKSDGGEATRKATLGFTLEMSCTEHDWTGRDSTDVNSARSCVLKHMDKAHGGKVAKDNPVWQSITTALTRVAKGDSPTAEGAFIKVSKAA